MRTTRRTFLAASAAAVAGPLVRSAVADEPKDKLRIAVIGVAGQGKFSFDHLKHENIVALCDVDEPRAADARQERPDAKFYTDYRRLFDDAKTFDAVAVCTPDHTHAHPTLLALSLGKHVYCEKPLCHSVDEVRRVRAAAKARPKLQTQMGTQIHAGDNYRRVVEVVRSGAIGPVKRVQVWCSRRPDGGRVVKPVARVKFDLKQWLGPCPDDFFYANHDKWPHFHWRWWWPFGGGVHADMGCHFTDLPHWALGLGAPVTVRATGTGIPNADNGVPNTLQVDYVYKTPGGVLPLTWYHGVAGPDLDGKVKYAGFGDGVCFEGEGGKKLVANYSKYQLFPDEFAREYKPPMPSIAKSIGHHKEWLAAIRGTGRPLCEFDYSAQLTEAVLLGNVSYRAGGVELAWDSKTGTTGNKEADAFLAREVRKGWEYPTA